MALTVSVVTVHRIHLDLVTCTRIVVRRLEELLDFH